MNRTENIPFQTEYPIMGKVTFKPSSIFKRKNSILVPGENHKKRIMKGYRAVITNSSELSINISRHVPCITGVASKDIEDLNSGDVLLIEPSKRINRLWNIKSIHNALMISHSCNCNCLMCPQPPQKDPDGLLQFNLQILDMLKDQPVKSIGLTGGEPTLKLNDLIEILRFCKYHFPVCSISLLSNGRAFCDKSVVKSISDIGLQNLLIGISLQADVEELHDEIMGVSGCFGETIRGIHNLALAKQRVEIRVVIIKENYQRLPQLAEFIYRNFPFARHIAFMGLEVTGKAEENIDKLWVDSNVYSSSLQKAVWHLYQRDLDVSIYNLPYCLLPRSLWKFARDSISDWKKTFLDPCMTCSLKARCPGVFSTSTRNSKEINPL